MKTIALCTALLLAGTVTPQIALAGPVAPSSLLCNDPPQVLEYSLGSYAAVGLDPSLEDALDDHLADIVTQLPGDGPQVTEGAVVMVARHRKIVYHKAIGLRDGNTGLGGSSTVTMPSNAIFDLESMTKPFTAAVILEMQAEGLLDIDDLVIDYLPEFEFGPTLAVDTNKQAVTIRDLLRYMSGLDVDATANQVYGATDPYLTMSHEAAIGPTGATVLYSDLGYRLLAHLAEVAYADAYPSNQRTFRQLLVKYVTGPLGMTETGFEPILTMTSKMSRVAGTGEFAHVGLGTPAPPSGYRRGEVQDDQDWWTQRNNAQFPSDSPTGAGCDGIFSTALDLGKFAQVLLDGGQIWDPYTCGPIQFLDPVTVSGLTTIQTVNSSNVAVGDAAPASWVENLLFANKAFGFELTGYDHAAAGDLLTGVYKTGGAGTFLMIDSQNDLFIVVLTNHGLPDPSDFGDQFAEMLEEIGPHRIADSVALAL